MFNRNIFSSRLLELRKAHRLSQTQLGEIAGLTQTAIVKIEKGERAASIEVLCALADYFDVSLDYLVGRTGADDSDSQEPEHVVYIALPETNSCDELEQQIEELLRSMNIPRHIKGFTYLKEAILLSITEADGKPHYDIVARRFETTSARVERAIRHAIMVSGAHDTTVVLSRLLENNIEFLLPPDAV